MATAASPPLAPPPARPRPRGRAPRPPGLGAPGLGLLLPLRLGARPSCTPGRPAWRARPRDDRREWGGDTQPGRTPPRAPRQDGGPAAEAPGPGAAGTTLAHHHAGLLTSSASIWSMVIWALHSF
ncbi:unnamed protein product [Nyctereutes procyonoides]|uniref:(raccoon dog) hypothetical protein n=1 Tax=Nyctereutes procyonoides TaxID=34880 RepID=A0A811YMF0_NYCPR|nr:unnamed protein product [Nyctereutes procyonoides]